MTSRVPDANTLPPPSYKMRTVNFIYNKNNHYGLEKDVRYLEHAFHRNQFNCHRLDPHEPPKAADINVHLEVPVYANISWAAINILLVNPEYYKSDAYDGYIDAFDFFVFRDQASWTLACGTKMGSKAILMPFSTPNQMWSKKLWNSDKTWLWIIGGSQRKMAAARKLLAIMKSTDQPVKIFCSDDLKAEIEQLMPANCVISTPLEDNYMAVEQYHHNGHIIISEAEGFSHVAEEARAVGAFMFASRLPAIIERSTSTAYQVQYTGSNAVQAADGPYYTVNFDDEVELRRNWESAQERLLGITYDDRKAAAAVAANEKKLSDNQWDQRIKGWKAQAEHVTAGGMRHVPPVVRPEDCPSISIVTPTYNRRHLIDIAMHSLLWSDYPIEKIQWIVVEDSDDPMKSSSDKLVQFAEKAKGLDFVYLPLVEKKTVGAKRNIGCAAAKHDIIVFMDDDDHYPPTSLRRRVSWLTKPLDGRPPAQAVGCTMIAMYDLMRGTSAVNVPPWGLPLGQRISEATLAFRKSFWQERQFSDVAVAEGEDWLCGRENAFLEIPPQQIIVAFTHGSNSCGRVVPQDANPHCFWNFSADYLKFIHGLVGITVELTTKA